MSVTIKSVIKSPSIIVPKFRTVRRKDYELIRDEAMRLYKDMNFRGEILKKRKRVSVVPFQYPLDAKRSRKDKSTEDKSKTVDEGQQGTAASKAVVKPLEDPRNGGNTSKKSVGVGKTGLSRNSRI